MQNERNDSSAHILYGNVVCFSNEKISFFVFKLNGHMINAIEIYSIGNNCANYDNI